jgi:hypothetical protein
MIQGPQVQMPVWSVWSVAFSPFLLYFGANDHPLTCKWKSSKGIRTWVCVFGGKENIRREECSGQPCSTSGGLIAQLVEDKTGDSGVPGSNLGLVRDQRPDFSRDSTFLYVFHYQLSECRHKNQWKKGEYRFFFNNEKWNKKKSIKLANINQSLVEIEKLASKNKLLDYSEY